MVQISHLVNLEKKKTGCFIVGSIAYNGYQLCEGWAFIVRLFNQPQKLNIDIQLKFITSARLLQNYCQPPFFFLGFGFIRMTYEPLPGFNQLLKGILS